MEHKPLMTKKIEFSLNSYLDEMGILSKDEYLSNDFVILPYFQNKYGSLYFTPESYDFFEYTEQMPDRYNIGILQENDDIKNTELNECDFQKNDECLCFVFSLPDPSLVIYVASVTLLPIAMDVVSSFIYDRLKGNKDKSGDIKVEFIMQDDNGMAVSFKYEGDPNNFSMAIREFFTNR
jgi:hypothetical protein